VHEQPAVGAPRERHDRRDLGDRSQSATGGRQRVRRTPGVGVKHEMGRTWIATRRQTWTPLVRTHPQEQEGVYPACIPPRSRPEYCRGRGHLPAKRAGLAKPEKPNEISYMAGRTGLEPPTSGRNPSETQGSEELKLVSRCIPTSPRPPAAPSAVGFGGTQSTRRDQFGLASEERPNPLKRHPTPRLSNCQMIGVLSGAPHHPAVSGRGSGSKRQTSPRLR